MLKVFTNTKVMRKLKENSVCWKLGIYS